MVNVPFAVYPLGNITKATTVSLMEEIYENFIKDSNGCVVVDTPVPESVVTPVLFQGFID
jgi:hypothetical protein